jgi:hypothetical protein
MKTYDFITAVTADKLNESMFKRFGTKVNFSKYTREELENYRNILRTKVHEKESDSKFNDLLSNESYQQDKHMLDLLNTKIKEMLGEGAKVDRQAKHITKSMMKSHPGMSKDDAEGAAWAHIKHPKKKKKAEEGIEETNMNKTNEGKKIDQNKDGKNDWEDVKIARMKASGAMKTSKVKEEMKVGDTKKSSTGGTITKTKTGVTHVRPSSSYSDEDGDDKSGKGTKSHAKSQSAAEKKDKAPAQKKSKSGTWGMENGAKFDNRKKDVKEGHYKLHVRLVNESLRYLIQEDEEGKAKAITAASDMVNDFTTWMQRVGQYQTKSMIELADAIRSEFGQAESDAFKNSVAPALSSTLDTLTSQREAISHAVAVLAGEATEIPQMGADMGGGDIPTEVEPDTMNPPEEMGDEFAASDAAAGGAETAGRATRESRQMNKLRQIAESHSIMSRLAR